MVCEFVVIGTSLGGFQALQIVLGDLPKDFPLPIAVIQHRSPDDSMRDGSVEIMDAPCV